MIDDRHFACDVPHFIPLDIELQRRELDKIIDGQLEQPWERRMKRDGLDAMRQHLGFYSEFNDRHPE